MVPGGFLAFCFLAERGASALAFPRRSVGTRET